MRWYINDASLQGQFTTSISFLPLLDGLIQTRLRFKILQSYLHTTRSFPDRNVTYDLTLRCLLGKPEFRDIRVAVFYWLDRTGPFVDDDRLSEPEDYFEFANTDVTDSGLGEAARRIKSGGNAITFSFNGGTTNYSISPLQVEHGLPEDRLGIYKVENLDSIEKLTDSASLYRPAPNCWKDMAELARERFVHLLIPDHFYTHTVLAREPFDSSICSQTMKLLKFLNDYMIARNPDGSEGPEARSIVENYFIGERALFTGESPSNQVTFKGELTFPDPENRDNSIFAHWHGKISHRFFRLHFEWPVPKESKRIKVLYVGPKITKS